MVLQSDAEAALELWLASPAYRSRPKARTGRTRRALLPKWARSDAASRFSLLMPPSTAGVFGCCLAHAAPHHTSPWTRYWRAVSCPGLLGACRRTLRACVRAVQRACGRVHGDMFVRSNKAVQKKTSVPVVVPGPRTCVGRGPWLHPAPAHDSWSRTALSGLGGAWPAPVTAHASTQQNLT